MRLKDKIVLITGGYTGIGKAIANRCLEEGAKVVVNGLREEKAEQFLQGRSKEHIATYTADITEAGVPESLIDFAIAQFGRLDVLVNNAALISSSNIKSTDLDFLRNMLEINTVAPFAMIRAALPHLAESKGNVLNIGSINSWSGEPDLLAYSISKGALMTLSRNLGDSLFRDYGVRVNQINPGWVLTDNEKINQREQGMKDDWFRELPDLFAPSRRILEPAEIAAGAAYLISDECGPISAQVLELEQFPMIGRNLPKRWEGFLK
ncbi:SDR family NAD(P)-dependent oxidoreductase [Poritiphilus flavus]|uniref:SDR family oxidoreductase n=1 Tax=Poritiphilus flavus TaxID=2697053 RepID=A0A6L9EES3_9FLAO|nr:SDR family NAD(P)-dependent oxidoreductase [Poritiphilus flavus]NAS13264.1 SDR family oxidoreductase [Poritiphilus flavus]